MDFLSFSWESYARYAEKHYGISGHNLRQLNWGCVPAAERAQFSEPPRVAYIGSLTSRYINLPLLSRLSKLYPHIDVYGGPPPDPSLGLNYLGWAPPTVLQQYQFGLITCTKDEIRRDGSPRSIWTTSPTDFRCSCPRGGVTWISCVDPSPTMRRRSPPS